MKIINNQSVLKQKPRDNYWSLVDKKSFGYVLFLLLVFAFSCSESTSTEGGDSRGSDSRADVERVVADGKLALNYADGFIYGTVKPVQNGVEVTNASFAIKNEPNDKITINQTNGIIMVASGLEVGEYSFTVEVIIPGTDGGSPKVITIDETLTIALREITEDNFTIPASVTRETNYTDTNYGKIVANDSDITATFAIESSNAPNNEITVNPENGEITVALGLPTGIYTFRVEVTGTGNYEGSGFITDDLKFSVTDNPITNNDFSVSSTSESREFGYNLAFIYGQVGFNPEITARLAIVKITASNNISVPPDTITVDSDNNIIVAPGLVVGDYTFEVEATGTGDYGGTANSEVLRLTITLKPITANDFEIDITSQSKEFGYTDTSYGNITLNAGVTATFDIVGITAPVGVSVPPDAITIDAITGEIRVATGLGSGKYSFTVEVTGMGNYKDTVNLGNLTLLIVGGDITANQFTIPLNKREPLGYTDVDYGAIIAVSGEITVNFEIANSNAPNNEIAIDSTTGKITVAAGLAAGEYTFGVKVTGTGSYTGSFIIDNLKFSVLDKIITKQDFRSLVISKNEEEFGYASSFVYGKIGLVDPLVTVNFAAVFIRTPANVSVPPNAITIDTEGNITVNPGLSAGTYTFQVEITGRGEYGGTERLDEEFIVITAKPVTKDNFTISAPPIEIKEFDYTGFTYGKISLNNPEITGNFTISYPDPQTATDKITVDENGNIIVAPGLTAATYIFEVQLTGTGNYGESANTEELRLIIIPRDLTDNDIDILFSTNQTKEYGYISFAYGRVLINNPEITGNFAIIHLDPQKVTDKIKVDENGNITVDNRLAFATYPFQVRFTGTGNYKNSVLTEQLKLTIKPRTIAINDFEIDIPSPTKEFGYTDTRYGKITPRDQITADFKIVNIITTPSNVSAPPGFIKIDEDGYITVAKGLAIRTYYTFQVEITGTGNYDGVEYLQQTLSIEPIKLTQNDFTSTPPYNSGRNWSVGYTETNFGKITPNDVAITADFSVVIGTQSTVTIPDNAAQIDANGNITVITGLEAARYDINIFIEGTGNYSGLFTVGLFLEIK